MVRQHAKHDVEQDLWWIGLNEWRVARLLEIARTLHIVAIQRLAWATALRVESTQLFDLRSALALCWTVLASGVASTLAAPGLRALLRVLLQA